MTPQEHATDLLRGYHAAQNGVPFQAFETPDWQSGFHLWRMAEAERVRTSALQSLRTRSLSVLEKIGLRACCVHGGRPSRPLKNFAPPTLDCTE